jgi:hypothetical protein
MFQHESGFWWNFALTSPEALYIKNVANELSFPLVTHTTCFNTRFGHYGFLKSGYGARQILDRLGIQMIDQVFGPQEEWNLMGFEYVLKVTCSAFQHLLEHTFSITAATVTAIWTQPMCGVWRVTEIGSINGLKTCHGFGQQRLWLSHLIIKFID